MNQHVVVVDDEPAIVEVVCEALEDEGITTTRCLSGHDAYPCIRRERPSLVILDVQMPGIDGITVFEQMRSEPTTRGIPVIFFTANAHKLTQRLPAYLHMGASLLPKPFDLDRLLDLVERSLPA